MSTLCASTMGPPPGLYLTQADNLPEFDESVIPNIKKLSNVHDLYLWGTCIQLSLGKRRLADLTSTILRPDEDHPKYNNWVKWSRVVSKWLIENVEESHAISLKAIQPALEFADTTYIAIQELDISKTYNEDMKAVHLFHLWSLRRHQFRGIDDFVDAWSEQVIRCHTLNITFNFLSATAMMLHEMEADMPILVKFIREQVENEFAGQKHMSYWEFKSIVCGIIRTVQKMNSRVSL